MAQETIKFLSVGTYVVHTLSAVTKNDNSACNPSLGDDNVLSIVIGVGLALVTLGYAAWSATADEKLSSRRYVPIYSF